MKILEISGKEKLSNWERTARAQILHSDIQAARKIRKSLTCDLCSRRM
jgi:hypothetical protein